MFKTKRTECVDLRDRFLNVESKLESLRKFESNLNFFINTFLDQGQVDKVLSALALEFWKACQQQISLQQRPWLEIEKGLEEMQSELGEMRENVLIRKKAFWDAHGAAGNRGFKIHGSSQDYLPADVGPMKVA